MFINYLTIAGRSPDLPGGSLEAGAPSTELNMPNKKKRGNCFSCAGDADKDEPYKRRKGSADFDFKGPRIGESMEMKSGGKFNLSGTDTDLEGDVGRGNAGFDFNGPRVGESMEMKAGGKFDLSGTDTDLGGDVGRENAGFDFSGPEVEMDANAPDINVPGGKMKTDISGPSVSLPAGEMKRAGRFDIGGSGPGFEGGGINKEIGLRGSGPDFDVHGGNKGGKLKTQLNVPSAKLDLPSKKKKCRNFLSCKVGADKMKNTERNEEMLNFVSTDQMSADVG